MILVVGAGITRRDKLYEGIKFVFVVTNCKGRKSNLPSKEKKINKVMYAFYQLNLNFVCILYVLGIFSTLYRS